MSAMQATSVGHALNFDVRLVGTVHSVFARAVNLEMREGLWTILAEDECDLPFGVRIAAQDFKALGLRPSDPVDVRAGFIGITSRRQSVVINCRVAPRWIPARQTTLEPGLADRLSALATAARTRAWCGSAAMAHSVSAACEQPDTLGSVLAGVIGRGPGLTPSGDDVLVGILAVLLRHTVPEAAIAADRLSRLIQPLLPTTTYISGQLLLQALNGFVGRAVDELLSALTSDPPPHRLHETIGRMVQIGATSGADTCMGVLAFAPTFLASRHQGMAA